MLRGSLIDRVISSLDYLWEMVGMLSVGIYVNDCVSW